MSKRFKKPAVFSIFCIIVLFVFLTTGCQVNSDNANSADNISEGSIAQTVVNTGSVDSADSITVNTKNTDNTENTENTENDLAGTCLRDKSCSYPGKCNDYTDINNNGLCDLGE
jgi:hypothetical protein